MEQTIFELIKKRSEIAGHRKVAQKAADALNSDLEAIDRALLLCGHGDDPIHAGQSRFLQTRPMLAQKTLVNEAVFTLRCGQDRQTEHRLGLCFTSTDDARTNSIYAVLLRTLGRNAMSDDGRSLSVMASA